MMCLGVNVEGLEAYEALRKCCNDCSRTCKLKLLRIIGVILHFIPTEDVTSLSTNQLSGPL